jgi:hypothetical protein
MNYRYTQKDIKIIDVNNTNDWMYNWIREKSGKGNNSGSSDNNTTYNTHSIEIDYCTKHHIRLNSDGLCSLCIEGRNV